MNFDAIFVDNAKCMQASDVGMQSGIFVANDQALARQGLLCACDNTNAMLVTVDSGAVVAECQLARS